MSNPAEVMSPAAEESEKDKRRRRRQRRSKHNLTSPLTGGFSSEGTPVREWTPDKPFNSLPNMHSSPGLVGPTPAGNNSRSCPLPSTSSHIETLSESPQQPSRMFPSNVNKKKLFTPYWSEQDVAEALEKGKVFEAAFRVNAHNRLEAYCTVEGLPMDVLIIGDSQNRAVEGDVVALMLDPVSSWTRLKGQNIPGNPANSDDPSATTPQVVGNYNIKNEVVDANNKGKSSVPDFFNKIKGIGFPICTSSSKVNVGLDNGHSSCNGHNWHVPDEANMVASLEQSKVSRALERIRAMITYNPSKRPTGKVVAVIKMSRRREAVIGFLSVNLPRPLCDSEWINEELSMEIKSSPMFSVRGYVRLLPADPKFPEMLISFSNLSECIKERVKKGDVTVEKELIAARIDGWSEECLYPQAQIVHVFGRGGEIEPQIAAVIFENAIGSANFSQESLACLPDIPYEVSPEEIKKRKDLRDICTFTIDPPSAIELDDALSVELVSDEILRVGVHIADVSYFVTPDTALDTEAQIRSTSVYILQHKVPMLPPRLSEYLASLNPGEDRLTVSVIWDMDRAGNVIKRWIGRSVIRSCCKLSYDFVQRIIDGSNDVNQLDLSSSYVPQLYGVFDWNDVLKSVSCLYEVSRKLQENRFRDGALSLDNSKLVFVFDQCGIPCDSFLNERMESCSLVEEFMLLANRSAAEVISRAFPDCALLRRHPEPDLRKLKMFEAFCSKHGFELDTSCSGQLCLSLSSIREELKDDPVLFDILINYATKPMQAAAYFCTGDLKDVERDWAHYALSVPLYTHFTSPIRRYPDIIVHRTLLAAVDAEEVYIQSCRSKLGGGKDFSLNDDRCFTGLQVNKNVTEMEEVQQAISAAADKFKVPRAEVLAEVAAYCNERKLASKRAQEAGEKVYLWAFLKRREILVSEARVLGLGPRFMSVYIHRFGIERRIHYDEVLGLSVEWFERTGTLLLDILRAKHILPRGNNGNFRAIADVALIVDPSNVFHSADDEDVPDGSAKNSVDPAVFPLTLKLLSSIPVVLHAVGGDDGPVDIGVKLYMCSYYS